MMSDQPEPQQPAPEPEPAPAPAPAAADDRPAYEDGPSSHDVAGDLPGGEAPSGSRSGPSSHDVAGDSPADEIARE